MSQPATCAKCGIILMVTEFCWYCDDTLCYYCWDDFGHCGHPEADAANEEGRKPRVHIPQSELKPIPHGKPLR